MRPPTIGTFAIVVLLCCSRIIELTDGATEYAQGYNAVTLDYKVHVDPSKEDCIYQYIPGGMQIFLDFAVIRGGDRQIEVGVTDPRQQVIVPYELKPEARYMTEKSEEGYYTICLNNRHSSYSAKLVSVYLSAYFARDWERFAAEITELEISAANATSSLTNVDSNLVKVLQHLHESRSRERIDAALLMDNHYYVSFWSIIQCLVIIGTSTVHVFFIRKLFDPPHTGKTRIRL